MVHSFDIEHASKYGLNEAIILYNIGYWIAKNTANEKHFYEGRYWTYNSYPAFHKLLPYLSEKQIKSAIQGLEKLNILKSGNFNSEPYDRTKWYTIIDEDVMQSFVTRQPKETSQSALEGRPIPYSKPDSKLSTKVETEVTPPRLEKALIKGDVFAKQNSFQNAKVTDIVETLQKHLGMTLDGSAKLNRRYAHLLLTKYSTEQIKALFTALPRSKFWSGKVTSVKDLYYNAAKIINSLVDQKGGFTDFSGL